MRPLSKEELSVVSGAQADGYGNRYLSSSGTYETITHTYLVEIEMGRSGPIYRYADYGYAGEFVSYWYSGTAGLEGNIYS